MTRKDYVQIAGILNDLWRTTSDPTQAPDIAVADAVYAIADYLASDNPNFDRGRFLKAVRG